MTFTSTYLGTLPSTFWPGDVCFGIMTSIGSDLVRGDLSFTSCYPSGYEAGLSSSGYYSASNCPGRYGTGCASFNTQFGLEVLCCLSDWSCYVSRPGPTTTGMDNLIEYGMCGSTFDISGAQGYTLAGNAKTFMITRLLGYGIRIRPDGQNIRAPTTVTETAAPGAYVTADLPQTTGATPTSDAVPAPESPGLATGAKVGLSVGVVVVLCVLAAAWMLIRRRRRRHLAILAGAELDAENTAMALRPELHAENAAMALRQELHAGPSPTYHELDSCQTEHGLRAELEVQTVVRTELSGEKS